MQQGTRAGQPGKDENAAGFLKPNAPQGTPPDAPVDLGSESVAGEEDPGAGMEQLQRKDTSHGH